MKVMPSESVPTAGTVVGVVQAKVPGTEVPETDAVPPVSVDAESICPTVIALAVGNVDMVGVALFTTSCTLPLATL